jgi:hypothetical protein
MVGNAQRELTEEIKLLLSLDLGTSWLWVIQVLSELNKDLNKTHRCSKQSVDLLKQKYIPINALDSHKCIWFQSSVHVVTYGWNWSWKELKGGLRGCPYDWHLIDRWMLYNLFLTVLAYL